MRTTSRREFLCGVGKGVGFTALGLALASRFGVAEALSLVGKERLRCGALDPLVDLLQETPPDALMPLLVQKLRSGTSLADLVGAAALCNARAFGGVNYNGYHALMAMMPCYEMAAQFPEPCAALPVLKVLHRNARFVQESGRATEDALPPLDGAVPGGAPREGAATRGANTAGAAGAGGAGLVESLRARDLPQAEASLAASQGRSPAAAYEELQTVVRDDMNVHRVVLSWRSWDLLRLTGQDQALTMLRQPVRFCIDEDSRRVSQGSPPNGIRELLPRLMDEHALQGRERGTRAADAAWIERLADTFFSGDRATAAGAAAAALAEGFDPEDVGRALSLAAARLLLNDPGQTKESPGKPVGSVHGASVGVHASDAANAWRHIARVGTAGNAFASLIAGAYHTAGQSDHVGALPHDHDGEPCTREDPAALLAEIDGRIRGREQKGACLAARRYCELGHPPDALFALLLGFAVSEDGALHSEKYFRTAQEEHASAHPAHGAAPLVALTRVMASQYGFPAPGCDEARRLLAS